MSIGFGERLAGRIDGVATTTGWKVSNAASGEVISSGTGPGLLDLVFERPGSYLVELVDNTASHEPGGCEHSPLPERITVKVGDVRMKFDLEGVTLSDVIVGGASTDGIKLRVPVDVEVFEGSTRELTVPDARAAGIGTTIVARPMMPMMVLTNGRTMIEYSLSGMAESGSYIMFDLVDPNGQVVLCPITQMIR